MVTIKTKDIVAFIWKVVRPYPISITFLFLWAIIWAIDISLTPYLLKIIINRATESTPDTVYTYLFFPAALFVLLSFFIATFHRIYSYYVEIVLIPNVRRGITKYIFSTLLDQSHHFYQTNFSGSLVNKVNDLIKNIPDIIEIVVERLLAHTLALLIAVFTLRFVHIKYALALLIWAATFIVSSLFCSKKIISLSGKWAEKITHFTGNMVDILSNILSVRLFARKKKELETISSLSSTVVEGEQKLQWFYFWIWFFYGYSFVVEQGFTIYFLLQDQQQNLITAGDFVLVLTINITVVNFLWQLAKDFTKCAKLFGVVGRALSTFNQPIEISDVKEARELVVSKGEIVFDKVEFYYEDAERLFEKKSVTILPGQKVGVVGYSGGGKTTFVNLILRLFDIVSGHISIDGQDVSQVTQDSLRRAIGMIPQDPSLFNRSIAENIRYGKPKASDAEVIDAAKRAHAHDFIMQQPEGYETVVGERGVKLSGGQRQRIAIARAILKNAPILILDEATSQLDSLTESLIQESLWKLMEGKTTLVIAHRLSTLLHMDRILVFEGGKIIEDGSHAQLLEKGGRYKSLWDAQVGGFLPEE